MPRRHRPPQRRRGTAKARGVLTTLMVDRLSASGEGLSGDIAIPFALPGETVEATVTGKAGTLMKVLEPTETRIPPACPHAGPHPTGGGSPCGGCTLQHWDDAALREMKTQLVMRAATPPLGSVEETPPVALFHQSPAQSRRRARLAFRRQGAGWVFGFRGRKSHDLVPMQDCQVLRPEILMAARRLSEEPLWAPQDIRFTDISFTLTGTGLDIDIGLDDLTLGLREREAIEAIAGVTNAARISVGEVPLVLRREPAADLPGALVPVPHRTFLQATAEAERAMIEIIMDAAKGARRIADLFCGIGTFAIPLSAAAPVIAADSDGPAIDTLDQVRRRHGLPITPVRRDLFEHPMGPSDLAGVDLVVMDPPRAGARAQGEALGVLMAAGEGPSRIVAVSCNPETLKRDLGALAPYMRVVGLHVIDQFRWSAHTEAIAVLERRGK